VIKVLFLQAYLTIADPQAQSMEERDVDPRLQYPFEDARVRPRAVHNAQIGSRFISPITPLPLIFVSRLLMRRATYGAYVTCAKLDIYTSQFE